MKPFRKTLVLTIMATGLVTIPVSAQASFSTPEWQAELDRAREKLGRFQLDSNWQGQIDQAFSELERVKPILEKFRIDIPLMPHTAWPGMDLAFLPQANPR